MAWTQYPLIKDVPTELGPVTLAFTRGDHVSISTDAHVNDDKPTVTYRDVEYLVHVHLYLDGDTWGPRDGSDIKPYVTRRTNSKDAPRTHVAAIVAALTDAVTAYVAAHPDVLHLAEYADATNDADRADEEVSKLTTQLKTAQAESRKARARASRHHALIAPATTDND